MNVSEKNIHNAQLSNNCPTCFAKDGLEISFTQAVKETAFHTTASSTIEGTFTCSTCNNQIYPVDWNDDLERVFDYHKKVATNKMEASQFKKAAYWSMGLLLILVGVGIYFTIIA